MRSAGFHLRKLRDEQANPTLQLHHLPELPRLLLP